MQFKPQLPSTRSQTETLHASPHIGVLPPPPGLPRHARRRVRGLQANLSAGRLLRDSGMGGAGGGVTSTLATERKLPSYNPAPVPTQTRFKV